MLNEGPCMVCDSDRSPLWECLSCLYWVCLSCVQRRFAELGLVKWEDDYVCPFCGDLIVGDTDE